MPKKKKPAPATGQPTARQSKRTKRRSRKDGTSSRTVAGQDKSKPQRLQRVLASAGFGSRRQCESLIEEGRVEVNGQTVTKLGTTVTPEKDEIRVDGDTLANRQRVYYAVHKPVGFVTTNRDPQGRPRVVDLVPPEHRVFPVGRLDRSSEGLILLTNDGELAQRLTHPRFGVRKVYRVTVAGKIDTTTMQQMRRGIHLAEGFVKVEGARVLKSRSRATELEMTLREGKNREIRRILARLGHKVQRLRRIAVGPLKLGDLPAGAYRVVTAKEVQKLWAATEASPEKESSRRPGKKRGSARPERSTTPNRGRTNTSSSTSTGRAKSPRRRATTSPVDSPRLGVVIGAEADGNEESSQQTTNTNRRRTSKSRRATSTTSRNRSASSKRSSTKKTARRKTAGNKLGTASKSNRRSRSENASTKKSSGRKSVASQSKTRAKTSTSQKPSRGGRTVAAKSKSSVRGKRKPKR